MAGFHNKREHSGGSAATDNRRIIPLNFLTTECDINNLGRDFVDKCFSKNKWGAPDVTVSQIRKLLSAVNMIQNKVSADEKNYNPGEIQYLRIKLAYQAGRESKLKRMQEELDPIIEKIQSPRDFKKFARLVESIIAYHKFYGGGN